MDAERDDRQKSHRLWFVFHISSDERQVGYDSAGHANTQTHFKESWGFLNKDCVAHLGLYEPMSGQTGDLEKYGKRHADAAEDWHPAFKKVEERSVIV
jgi:hypothetical protein